ncbi:MAG TPA: hypothetical protein VMZ53_04950 [Kofleriaceae bacterium]|nr:hypothetical protein [Kofleriaceae bacterium]
MKKFFLVVVGVVALGLALRFTLNKKPKQKADATKPPTVVVNTPPPDEQPPATPDQPPPTPTTTPTPAPDEPPPPPRIAGSVQISDVQTQWFASAPGVLYYCERGTMYAQSKSGGAAVNVGDCGSAFDMRADAQGVVFCDGDGQLMRITAGADNGSQVIAGGLEGCITSAIDGKWAYFVVPGFEGTENPGLFRVLRSGGTPEKIHATRPKEQFMVAVDDDAVWIGAWAAGTISKLGKTPGSKARTVVTGQKGIVDLAIDGNSLYWYAEGTGEVRRRKKTGGAIEVVGHDVDQEPVVVTSDGHAYWFEGKAGEDKRLVHLAPGAAKSETIASGLKAPSLRADTEGVYVTELDRDGIFMFKR